MHPFVQENIQIYLECDGKRVVLLKREFSVIWVQIGGVTSKKGHLAEKCNFSQGLIFCLSMARNDTHDLGALISIQDVFSVMNFVMTMVCYTPD